MNLFQKSDAAYLLAFFLTLMALGAALLMLPAARMGPERIAPVDALFTAAAASCVTGLAVIDTSSLSTFGQIVLFLLVQIGGLGIIGATSLLLIIPGNRLTPARRDTIRGFYLDGVEYRPRRIIRNIIFFALGIEAAGAVVLALLFRGAGRGDWLYLGIFHAVTSFCNAGLSPLSGGIAAVAEHRLILSVMMVLIVCGGLGFIVLHDILRRVRRRKPRLSYHSRIVLFMSGVLIAGGALLYFLIGREGLYRGMNVPAALFTALFQSVSARSAGFEILPVKDLSSPARLLTGLLMLIGGAPASGAGGLKVTTVFVIAVVMLRRPDQNGDIKISRHRLTAETINRAVVYTLKAAALLYLSVGALFCTEGAAGTDAEALIMEAAGAFSTAGLSMGITAALSPGGKLVIIAAVLAGRVGLFALAFPWRRHKNYHITYPEGTILLG